MGLKLRNMTTIFLLKDDSILMLYRRGGRVANNLWVGSAGGHFEKDELNDPLACVLRELREEIGLGPEALGDIALRYVTLRYVDGEIRQNYYYFAALLGEAQGLQSCEGTLQWFPLSEIGGLEMPRSARYMMDHYLEVGRFDDKLYGGVSGEDGLVFTELAEK